VKEGWDELPDLSACGGGGGTSSVNGMPRLRLRSERIRASGESREPCDGDLSFLSSSGSLVRSSRFDSFGSAFGAVVT
jgi:hypothetical protein